MNSMCIVASLVLALGLFAAPASADAKVALRFAHAQPPDSTTGRAAELFKKLVEKRSNGDITVAVYPNNQLGNNAQMVDGVRLGTIDLTANGNPYYTKFDPEMNVLDLPYLFKNHQHAYAVLDGKIGQKLFKGLESHGLKGLAYWEIGFRCVTNSKRPIRVPADMKGLKIRTTPNPASIKAFNLLGAHPVPMSFGDVYMALQTGAVDGQENPINLIYANRFNEVQKYLSLTDHEYTALIFVMNLNRFKSLTQGEQKIILDAAHEAAVAERADLQKNNSKELEELKKAGMQVVENVDKKRFRDIIYQPVVDEYTKKFGSKIVDAIVALRKDF